MPCNVCDLYHMQESVTLCMCLTLQIGNCSCLCLHFLADGLWQMSAIAVAAVLFACSHDVDINTKMHA